MNPKTATRATKIFSRERSSFILCAIRRPGLSL